MSDALPRSLAAGPSAPAALVSSITAFVSPIDDVVSPIDAGGEKIALLLAELATKHGVTLPKISVEEMKADLTLASRLSSLAADVHAYAQRLDDTSLEANSEAWWAATAFYTALARMAPADPALQSALAPAVEFFAVGRRKAAPSDPSKK